MVFPCVYWTKYAVEVESRRLVLFSSGSFAPIWLGNTEYITMARDDNFRRKHYLTFPMTSRIPKIIDDDAPTSPRPSCFCCKRKGKKIICGITVTCAEFGTLCNFCVDHRFCFAFPNFLCDHTYAAGAINALYF